MRFPIVMPKAATLCATVLLCACNADVTTDLTISPAEGLGAETLKLSVSEVRLLTDEDETLDGDGSGSSIDLMAYVDGGLYQASQFSVDLDASVIGVLVQFDDDATLSLADGGEYTLAVEEADDYADVDLEIDSESSSELIVTLELPFSLIAEGGDYTLHPVLRAVSSDDAASLSGEMSSAHLHGESCSASEVADGQVAAYLFQGSGKTPSDYYRNGTVASSVQPYASAPVSALADGTGYTFTFRFLPGGNYTVAVTCEADDEDPASLDGLDFIDSLSATLADGEDLSLDFPD